MKTLALAAVLATALVGGKPADVSVVVGSPAPDFEGTWLNHPDTSLMNLAGRIVFVEVWRTW